MRVPITGICAGFRVIKAQGKEGSDYGKIFVLQPGDKDHDAFLITIIILDLVLLEFLLTNYSDGRLYWINVYATQQPNGREMIWVAEKIAAYNGMVSV